jgi:HSP20 family molecular chaperone IbpA
MRFRRVSYRYAVVTHRIGTWALHWQTPVVSLVEGRPYWQPDADMWETARAIEIAVDLAGVEDDDVDVQIFDDAVVVEGRRKPPAWTDNAVWHTARVRQGPFRLELPLVAAVDPDAVEARYERGMLRIALPKRGAGR